MKPVRQPAPPSPASSRRKSRCWNGQSSTRSNPCKRRLEGMSEDTSMMKYCLRWMKSVIEWGRRRWLAGPWKARYDGEKQNENSVPSLWRPSAGPTFLCGSDRTSTGKAAALRFWNPMRRRIALSCSFNEYLNSTTYRKMFADYCKERRRLWHQIDLNNLPVSPCCYVLYFNGRLGYIGSTDNLRARLSKHLYFNPQWKSEGLSVKAKYPRRSWRFV